MDLVSVIIPVFNGETTIAEALDSVLAQTHERLQVLVIDDGSTDRTSEVVRSRADPRVHLRRFSNLGAPASRNRGIREATGCYVSFLDADDVWAPDKIEKQVAALVADRQAGVAYSFTWHMSEDGLERHRGYEGGATGYVLPQLFVRFFLESGSNALLRRQVFAHVGDFDETLPLCDDYDFYLRVAEHFAFTLVPEALVRYRRRAGSLSSDAAGMHRYAHRVIERAVRRQPEILGPLKHEARAVTDSYILGKIALGPRDWRSLALGASCLYGYLRAGRPVVALRLARQYQAGRWLADATTQSLVRAGWRSGRRDVRHRR